MDKNEEKRLWFHLAVTINIETGLYHGAIYRNRPTGDFDRFFLDKTTKEGFMSPRRAAEEINAFVEREKLDIKLLKLNDHEDIPPIPDLSGLPEGVTFTLVTPHKKKERAYVEICLGRDKLIEGVELHPSQLKRLALYGFLELDSSSGRNPELSATYDHYFFTKKGLRERRGELA